MPDDPVDLLTPREMAEADRLAAALVPSLGLMENAGAAVAQAALDLLPGRALRRVLVLCGPGNNGGDGWVAARRLAEAGCAVTVASSVDRAMLKGDAAAMAARWTGGTVVGPDAASFEGQDLVVDALLGAGLARDVEGRVRDLIERVNAWRRGSARPLLAVDVPSGIDGETGQVRGAAVEASACVTFFRYKPGHLLLPGRLHCGRLTLADIGLPAEVLDHIAPRTVLNVPASWRAALPVPTLAGHKYARGHAVVMSGPLAQTGAARLAARGALRAGAGLVTVATPAAALPVHAAALTAIMTRVVDDAADFAALLADPRKNVVVLGPGLGTGEGTRALVQVALAPAGDRAPSRRVVLDADALTSFAECPCELFAAIADGGHATVLTPHDGEFAKLFGSVVDATQAKPARARAAAVASGATVVLKGPDTVVAHPDGRAAIARSEAPWLATAGSGDVLAGMVAGLLAQGMPPFEAASAAVWMHAEAARRFGPGLISEDLPDALPPVLRALHALPTPEHP